MGKITGFTGSYLLILVLLFTGIASAQIVNIPDANFKAKLLAASPANTIAYGNNNYIKIDTNDDGEIQVVEAQAVDSLNILSSSIANVAGIAAFANLKKLDCSSNLIQDLDVSGNTLLVELFCWHNNLTSLVLNGTNNLEVLDCTENQLTALDLSGHPNLITVGCSNNSINTIDLTGCSNLYQLYCFQNNIAAIDLNGLSALKDLFCSNNVLTGINLSPVPQLEYLECSNNPISTIDVSFLVSLHSFGCENTLLSTIDVSNLTGLTDYFGFGGPSVERIFMKNGVSDAINMSQCVNLQYVCGDEAEATFLAQNLSFTDSNPNAVINSYCNFTPGGSYNQITGTITFDLDNNGCDAADEHQPHIRVDVAGPVDSGATFTGSGGIYNIYSDQTGTFTFAPNIENVNLFTISPANAVINFPDSNNNVATQDFCISANGIQADAEIVINTIEPAKPGFSAMYEVLVRNKGNQAISGTYNLAFSSALMSFTGASITPDSQNTGILSWNYTNLLPFQSLGTYVWMHINTPVQVPPVNVGDVLVFTGTINLIAADVNPSDNQFVLNQTVVGSYDPNNKTCLEGNVISPSEIGKYVHYNINFENTGTDFAQNIVVKDVIDTSKFDINSLYVMSSSHLVDTKITGNVVEFIFKNILLPIGGHGNVLFKIKTLPTLAIGDEVANTADIFFDYNAPIATNEARTAFQLLANTNFAKDSSIAIYPNPAKSNISIRAKSNIQSVQLFDIQGRILQTSIENKPTVILDISNQQSGVYFLKVMTAAGSNTQKIIKQ